MKILITNDEELLGESCLPDNICKQILGTVIDVEKVGTHPTNYLVRYRGYLLYPKQFTEQQTPSPD